jgi:hypothetical protein
LGFEQQAKNNQIDDETGLSKIRDKEVIEVSDALTLGLGEPTRIRDHPHG